MVNTSQDILVQRREAIGYTTAARFKARILLVGLEFTRVGYMYIIYGPIALIRAAGYIEGGRHHVIADIPIAKSVDTS